MKLLYRTLYSDLHGMHIMFIGLLKAIVFFVLYLANILDQCLNPGSMFKSWELLTETEMFVAFYFGTIFAAAMRTCKITETLSTTQHWNYFLNSLYVHNVEYVLNFLVYNQLNVLLSMTPVMS